MLSPLLLLALSFTASAGPCVAVRGDRITAADFARAVAAFGELPGETEIALAPSPGVERHFSRFDVIRLFRRYELEGAPGEACFTVAARELRPEDFENALREASDRALEVRIEILDWSRHPVPEGKLEFSASHLSTARPDALDGSVLLRGRVTSTGRRTVPVWVKAAVFSSRACLVARQGIQAREVIARLQIEPATCEVYPWADPPLENLDLVVGGRARRAIAAGDRILAADVEPEWVVERGDTVAVRVSRGLAVLQFDATVEGRGRRGDRVVVKSPLSGKRLDAVVVGRGSVEIRN